MSDVFFTSDTHFNHRSMPSDGKGWRPQYATLAEHDHDLAERWNAAVRPDDTVWHLGDFALGSPADFLPLVGKLHGTIHLVTGNHDRPWPANRDAHKHQAAWIAAGFASVQAFARRRIAGRQVLLSHLPYDGDHLEDERYVQYRLRDCGVPLLCGHVHHAWAERDRQYNVGVDVRGYAPVPIEEIADWLVQTPDEES